MKILAVANQRGGVGKTTLALNLAIRCSMGAIPEVKKRVLILDTDHFQNLSNSFCFLPELAAGNQLPPARDPSVYKLRCQYNWGGLSSSTDIFFGMETTPWRTPYTNIDILPARPDHLKSEFDQLNIVGVVANRAEKVPAHQANFERLQADKSVVLKETLGERDAYEYSWRKVPSEYSDRIAEQEMRELIEQIRTNIWGVETKNNSTNTKKLTSVPTLPQNVFPFKKELFQE